MSMNKNMLIVLKAYLTLSAHDRIDLIKEINRVEKMPRVVKKDHENLINSLTT
jgi:hypothetical protein